MKIINVDDYSIYKIFNMIDTGDINEVIDYAKKEDIFAEKVNRFQNRVVQKIKDRLEKEGLSLDILRSD